MSEPTTPSDRTEPTLQIPHTSTMFFNSVNREVMRITAHGQLIPGEGLSQDEATQGMFAVLQKLFTAHVAGVCREKDAIIRNNCSDWAEDHTHLQTLARAAGCSDLEVDGDRYGVPGIIDLANSIVAARDRRIAELEGELRTRTQSSLAAVAMGEEILTLRATLLATQTALEQAKADTVRLDWLEANPLEIGWRQVHAESLEIFIRAKLPERLPVFGFATFRAAIDHALNDAASAQPKQEGAK